jgi:hypothetical protein
MQDLRTVSDGEVKLRATAASAGSLPVAIFYLNLFSGGRCPRTV